jgi:hypothetical protein
MLVGLAVGLAVTPTAPEPQLFESLRMLRQGKWSSSMGMFNLVFHLSPTVMLGIRLAR